MESKHSNISIELVDREFAIFKKKYECLPK